MQIWAIVAIVATVLIVLREVLKNRFAGDTDAIALSAYGSLYGAIILLPGVVYEHVILKSPGTISPKLLGIAMLGGVFGAVGVVASFMALERVDLSVYTPLSKVGPIIVVLLEPALVPAANPYHVQTVAAGLLAGVGAVVASTDRGVFAIADLLSPGTLLAILTAAASAFGSLATRTAAQEMPPFTYAIVWATTLFAVCYVAYLSRDVNLEKPVYSGCFIIVGVVSAVAGIAVTVAFSLASASRIAVITQTGMIIAVLYGGFVLDESYIARRLGGSALIFGGVILVL